MNNSTSLARVIVRQIIEAGITDVVVSPGSRNAPLSLAFFAASKRGLIKLHVRIDERTAAAGERYTGNQRRCDPCDCRCFV